MMTNLVSNAVKFTPAGGMITMSAAVDEAGLRMTVADTGVGIPAADIERVLEPFAQVQAAQNADQLGTGLGLSLVKSLVERHGGLLTIESAVGRGTSATLTFPAYRLRPRTVIDRIAS